MAGSGILTGVIQLLSNFSEGELSLAKVKGYGRFLYTYRCDTITVKLF